MDELRARLRRAEEDAAAARILAGGADRDVGELGREFREFRDQNNRVLSAMRADLTDLRTEMPDLRGEVRRGFAEVDRGFAEVRGRLDAGAAGQQQIVDLLSSMIEQGDDRPPR